MKNQILTQILSSVRISAVMVAAACGPIPKADVASVEVVPASEDLTPVRGDLTFSCNEHVSLLTGSLVFSRRDVQDYVSGSIRLMIGDSRRLDQTWEATPFTSGFSTLLSPVDLMIATLVGDDLVIELRLSDGSEHHQFSSCVVTEV